MFFVLLDVVDAISTLSICYGCFMFLHICCFLSALPLAFCIKSYDVQPSIFVQNLQRLCEVSRFTDFLKIFKMKKFLKDHQNSTLGSIRKAKI
jgi:hypothetical protein